MANNQLQNISGKYHTAKSRMVFAIRIICTGLITAGLALIIFGAIKQLSSATGAGIGGKQQLTLSANISAAPDPSLLTIPSLKIAAPFEPLALNPDHTLEVPKNNMGVGWFVYGAKPGEVGSAVVVGHLDSASGPAIFADLNKIKPGDKILINRTDGSLVTYRVNSLSKFSQDNFPTAQVYGAIPYAGLRLITCSGVWEKQAGHYSDNLIVFATQI